MGESELNEIAELKAEFDRACNSFKELGDKTGCIIDLGFSVRMGMTDFLSYLAACDGLLTLEEAKVISAISGENKTPGQIGFDMKYSKIFSPGFKKNVPYVFRLLVKVEADMIGQGSQSDVATSLINMYRVLGEFLITVDGKANDAETEALNGYIGLLERHRNKKLKAARAEYEAAHPAPYSVPAPPKKGVSGQSTGVVSAPSKSKVSAPKKE